MTENTNPDPLAAEFTAEATAALSPETRAAVAALVDRRIEREHGTADDTQVQGARRIAVAGIQMDIHRTYVKYSGSDRGVATSADLLLRHLVDEGLAARLCHCAHLHPHGCPHGSAIGQLFCGGHYEADVPAIDGALLCGTCHVAEYQTRL